MRVAGACVTLLILALAGRTQAQEGKAPAAAPGVDQSEDAKAKALREAYEEQLRRERQLVTIKARNARVQDVVEMFRAQAGVNILLDTRNFPDDFRVDEFVVDNESFRKALEGFAAKAELAIDDMSPTLIRLSRPARVSFNFRDADVKVVIDMIARVSGANIVVSSDVKGLITLSITNVPWNEVLAAVVKTLGFTTVQENFGVIRIIHPDELKKQMETRVFRLKFIQPPPLYAAKVEEGKTVSGRPLTAPTQVEELMKRFTLRQVLDTVLSKDAGGRVLGKLDFDPSTNAFVVTDTQVVLNRVEEIIKLLDVEPEQVLIDVKYVSTTNDELLSFGMNYSFASAESGKNAGIGIKTTVLDPRSVFDTAGALGGKITRLPFGLGQEPGAYEQFFLTEYDMNMTFRAFKKDSFSRIMQEPTLAVLDNTEATIFVGESISYAESRAVSNQNTGALEFTIAEAAKSPIKVGFQLFVIPKIVIDSNKVILTIIPQNEFLVTGTGTAGLQHFEITAGGAPQSIDLPRIRTNMMVTKLILESGRTAVLGGLVVENTAFEDTGIPVLKDLPIVSYLFKQRNDTVRREHLLVFVTPRIVRRGNLPSEALQQALRAREEAEQREYERIKRLKSRDELKKALEEREQKSQEEMERMKQGAAK